MSARRVTVRLAREDEADDIAELQKQLFPGEERPDPHDAGSTAGALVWWVAVCGDEVVGFAAIHVPTWYLAHCGVVPLERGRGLQRRLVRARLRFARKCGATRVVTDTYGSVTSGNNLIRCGFRLFDPPEPWKASGALYWQKEIQPCRGSST